MKKNVSFFSVVVVFIASVQLSHVLKEGEGGRVRGGGAVNVAYPIKEKKHFWTLRKTQEY